MLTALMVLLRSIGLICCGHRAIALENLALPPAVGRTAPHRHASTPTLDGPTLLDPPRQGLAGLALRLDRRAARNRGPMASPMASLALDPAVTTEAPMSPE